MVLIFNCYLELKEKTPVSLYSNNNPHKELISDLIELLIAGDFSGPSKAFVKADTTKDLLDNCSLKIIKMK